MAGGSDGGAGTTGTTETTGSTAAVARGSAIGDLASDYAAAYAGAGLSGQGGVAAGTLSNIQSPEPRVRSDAQWVQSGTPLAQPNALWSQPTAQLAQSTVPWARSDSQSGPVWGAYDFRSDAPTAQRNTTQPDTLFADASTLYTARAGVALPQVRDTSPMVNNYYFVGSVMLLFAVFCYLVYNYRQSVSELLSEGFTDRILKGRSLVFLRFLAYGLGMSLLLGALVLVKTADVSAVDSALSGLPGWAYAAAVPTVYILLMLYVVYRRSVSGLIGKVTFSEQTLGQYRLLSRISLLVSVFLITPVFLLLVFSRDTYDYLFVWLMAGMAASLYLVYLVRSLIFFRQKKVSIVHWFLYLCAVEFLPLSFVLVTAVRYSN